jgi:hypothetical protein
LGKRRPPFEGRALGPRTILRIEVVTVNIVEGLAWKLEEVADRVDEWASWTSLSLTESLEDLWDRVSEVPRALSDYFQGVGFRLEGLTSRVEDLSARLREWWEEQKAHFQEVVGRIRAHMEEIGAWIGEKAEKVALGVGVAGIGLGVAGLGAERIGEDVREFYRGATVVVQVELKERFAAFLEEVGRLDDLAKQIVGDIAQGKLPSSFGGETSYGKGVDPNYGERADPKAGPEPW